MKTIYVPLGTFFNYIDENAQVITAESGLTCEVNRDGAVTSIRGFHGFWTPEMKGTLAEKVKQVVLANPLA